MSTPKLRTLAIVGVGLIGGSIGLAAKQRGLVGRVLGVGRQQASLDEALAVRAIDEAFLEITPAVRQADLTVFCTPVDRIAGQVLAAAPHCQAGAILTDAGSTKSAIVRAIDGQLPAGVHFVGSHPLAGSEKRGPHFADARLFEGRVTIVTRTDQTDPMAWQRISDFWQSLGSRVKLMDPETHDRALALTSHLPHLVASALAGILPPELADLAASGFRDTTRVAAGDPVLWTGIFEQNRPALLASLTLLEERLRRFRDAIDGADRDAVDRLLKDGKTLRDSLESRPV